ncbi:unnamed protein product [Ambrosiozyma monospora]|uniref:Unnamed protein product n=1 Tax=Ambrosiozyma monospora TaxID=43982 RepID=A0A9W6YZJ4_AMBMO|nr:unnamed protein product [Ambrosiozyma monospora]
MQTPNHKDSMDWGEPNNISGKQPHSLVHTHTQHTHYNFSSPHRKYKYQDNEGSVTSSIHSTTFDDPFPTSNSSSQTNSPFHTPLTDAYLDDDEHGTINKWSELYPDPYSASNTDEENPYDKDMDRETESEWGGDPNATVVYLPHLDSYSSTKTTHTHTHTHTTKFTKKVSHFMTRFNTASQSLQDSLRSGTDKFKFDIIASGLLDSSSFTSSVCRHPQVSPIGKQPQSQHGPILHLNMLDLTHRFLIHSSQGLFVSISLLLYAKKFSTNINRQEILTTKNFLPLSHTRAIIIIAITILNVYIDTRKLATLTYLRSLSNKLSLYLSKSSQLDNLLSIHLQQLKSNVNPPQHSTNAYPYQYLSPGTSSHASSKKRSLITLQTQTTTTSLLLTLNTRIINLIPLTNPKTLKQYCDIYNLNFAPDLSYNINSTPTTSNNNNGTGNGNDNLQFISLLNHGELLDSMQRQLSLQQQKSQQPPQVSLAMRLRPLRLRSCSGVTSTEGLGMSPLGSPFTTNPSGGGVGSVSMGYSNSQATTASISSTLGITSSSLYNEPCLVPSQLQQQREQSWSTFNGQPQPLASGRGGNNRTMTQLSNNPFKLIGYFKVLRRVFLCLLLSLLEFEDVSARNNEVDKEVKLFHGCVLRKFNLNGLFTGSGSRVSSISSLGLGPGSSSQVQPPLNIHLGMLTRLFITIKLLSRLLELFDSIIYELELDIEVDYPGYSTLNYDVSNNATGIPPTIDEEHEDEALSQLIDCVDMIRNKLSFIELNHFTNTPSASSAASFPDNSPYNDNTKTATELQTLESDMQNLMTMFQNATTNNTFPSPSLSSASYSNNSSPYLTQSSSGLNYQFPPQHQQLKISKRKRKPTPSPTSAFSTGSHSIGLGLNTPSPKQQHQRHSSGLRFSLISVFEDDESNQQRTDVLTSVRDGNENEDDEIDEVKSKEEMKKTLMRLTSGEFRNGNGKRVGSLSHHNGRKTNTAPTDTGVNNPAVVVDSPVIDVNPVSSGFDDFKKELKLKLADNN